MCGRYSASFTPEELRRRFQLPDFTEHRLQPRFNVAPTDLMPVMVERPAGRALAAFRWGFQPDWLKPGRACSPFATRSPGLGYHENVHITPWQARPEERRKAPHHIRLRGGEVLGFAGLYTPPSADRPGTYCIVTVRPNELLAPIHDRMPAILEREWEALWLDPTVTDPFAVLPLLQPFPAERMEAYRVGYAVGAVANDDTELLLPLC
jgi:putative SOS response-associated peptidase YedK